ncbi:MAG: sugar ABC transporter substrate-binding protein, partial [Caldilineaceae bacterium]|nr:sugar ABC transporter substrate-binding protein [Caldilineaceae bacterium]
MDNVKIVAVWNRQRRLSVVLLGALLLLLAGCTMPTPTGEGRASSESARRAEEADHQISFMVFGDPAEKVAYEALVSAFNDVHPEIAVELQHIPGQSDYRKRLGTDFAAGTPADIVLINYRRYAPFAAKGVLEPIGPYLDQSDKIKVEDFYEQAIAPYRWDGTLMCIPQNLSSLVVYYNRDLFEKAGVPLPSNDWTWDEFLAAAQAITQDTDGDGITDIYGIGTDATIFRVAPFVWANGGDLVDDPSNPTKLTLDAPATKEALQWFIDLQVKHQVAPGLIEEQAEASENRFLNGRLGMFLNSRRGVPTYRTIENFAWDVAPLPVGP